MKWWNDAVKCNVIKGVFEPGETLDGEEITKRVNKKGYKITRRQISIFIHYHMENQYIRVIKRPMPSKRLYQKIGV
ncbi:hypothetical protein LCGC14_2705140 [marine sediment metagenome]|uniref:Uncharacterized protein n=1 Tax=marine sediment metagenome TaxID=412755 RepID=A0A0F8ZEG2_9ZZZZ